ncbi:S8 family serine peptidase [Hymenobacter sp. BT683]|uniref:S8 family serine peptidase n=1 Tax=Hymenobacter jeongseonensis TaxID=2791027 RepID=A0ABS0ID17_9BACT|nr:S8 family serine peptidase [Hymenobacter jeongseonensis]MBF9236242.1 S8 family serine peptidase [Hymenobacter jeongseonensis]
MYNHKLTHHLLPVLGLGLLFTFGCSKENPTPTDPSITAVSSQAIAAGTPGFTLRSKHYIIIAAGDELPAGIEGLTTAANGKVTSVLQEVGLALATSDDPEFAAKAAKITGVRSVVRDFTYQGFNPEARAVEAEALNVNPASTGDSNPYLPLQWGATAIQAPAAWNAGALGENVLVADLDGGFELTHPDLVANIQGSKSFVPTEPAQFMGAANKSSHGTHTAGTIAAADNSIGVIGVAPKAKLLLVKVLADAGSGSFSWMLQGILYAVQERADVINLSLGAAIPRHDQYLDENGKVVNDTKAIQELLVAINKVTSYATKNGVTIIASAGNDANNGNQDKSTVHIPADATGVISISSTGPMGWALDPLKANLDRFASYSNYGTSAIDFAAPGGDFALPGSAIVNFRGVTQYAWALDMVISTGRVSVVNGITRGSYTWMAGTSMAAPHATGIAALIIGRNGGSMDPVRVEAALRASADDLGQPGRDAYYGQGRLNAFRAVSQAQ